MSGIIDRIIRFYRMRFETLDVVLGNTEKVLMETESERKAVEETEKLQSFVKNMTWDVDNMLTRFYSRKRRKEKRCQRLSDEEVNALEGFADFARNLATSVPSWLSCLRKNETYEEKLDEEIKRLETYVKKRIKEFDEVLEDALSGRGRMFMKRLAKRLGDVAGSIVKPAGWERLRRAGSDIQRHSQEKAVILEDSEWRRRDSRRLKKNSTAKLEVRS